MTDLPRPDHEDPAATPRASRGGAASAQTPAPGTDNPPPHRTITNTDLLGMLDALEPEALEGLASAPPTLERTLARGEAGGASSPARLDPSLLRRARELARLARLVQHHGEPGGSHTATAGASEASGAVARDRGLDGEHAIDDVRDETHRRVLADLRRAAVDALTRRRPGEVTLADLGDFALGWLGTTDAERLGRMLVDHPRLLAEYRELQALLPLVRAWRDAPVPVRTQDERAAIARIVSQAIAALPPVEPRAAEDFTLADLHDYACGELATAASAALEDAMAHLPAMAETAGEVAALTALVREQLIEPRFDQLDPGVAAQNSAVMAAHIADAAQRARAAAGARPSLAVGVTSGVASGVAVVAGPSAEVDVDAGADTEVVVAAKAHSSRAYRRLVSADTERVARVDVAVSPDASVSATTAARPYARARVRRLPSGLRSGLAAASVLAVTLVGARVLVGTGPQVGLPAPAHAGQTQADPAERDDTGVGANANDGADSARTEGGNGTAPSLPARQDPAPTSDDAAATVDSSPRATALAALLGDGRHDSRRQRRGGDGTTPRPVGATAIGARPSDAPHVSLPHAASGIGLVARASAVVAHMAGELNDNARDFTVLRQAQLLEDGSLIDGAGPLPDGARGRTASYISGDVSGDGTTDGKDALIVLSAVLNGTASRLGAVADVNGDGIVDLKDSMELTRRLHEYP